MRIKAASIKDAIDWIAQNDEPNEHDPDELVGLASVSIVAEIFGLSREEVVTRVLRRRQYLEKLEG